ncbi:hypothetical protein BDV98DRAFT_313288 [Pterulicium gracile]|uniref:Uncharacterized protein n=1 Tax=Pterulicium gracile TaxID=1884261 RepID=A0A5C3QVD0_9AGAR|nr:hypothetical protein BDV98DRAFT_313288 [Pterula gracilis]
MPVAISVLLGVSGVNRSVFSEIIQYNTNERHPPNLRNGQESTCNSGGVLICAAIVTTGAFTGSLGVSARFPRGDFRLVSQTCSSSNGGDNRRRSTPTTL